MFLRRFRSGGFFFFNKEPVMHFCGLNNYFLYTTKWFFQNYLGDVENEPELNKHIFEVLVWRNSIYLFI